MSAKIKAKDDNNNIITLRATNDAELKTSQFEDKTHINSQVLLTSPTGIAVYAGTTPAPTNDPDLRKGWLFTKTAAGTNKFNYYFYGEGSSPMTLGNLTNINAIVSVDNYQDFTSLPFFVVYTKPTGVGDAGAFFHSSKAFTINLPFHIDLSEKFNMWAISEHTYYNNHRSIKCNAPVVVGTAADSEEILFITIHS